MQTTTNDTKLGDESTGKGRLYCYLDESGNFDFGETGSEYYFQSALVTDAPFPLL